MCTRLGVDQSDNYSFIGRGMLDRSWVASTDLRRLSQKVCEPSWLARNYVEVPESSTGSGLRESAASRATNHAHCIAGLESWGRFYPIRYVGMHFADRRDEWTVTNKLPNKKRDSARRRTIIA